VPVYLEDRRDLPEQGPGPEMDAFARMLAGSETVPGPQLREAVGRAGQTNRWLGDLLVEMGALTPGELADLLAARMGFQKVDLSSYPVELEAVALLPESLALAARCLPLARTEGVVYAAMVNPLDPVAIELLAAKAGLVVEPMVAVERDLKLALARLHGRLKEEAGGEQPAAAPVQAPAAAKSNEVLHVDDLLHLMMERKASDLHLCVGSPPVIRVHGEMEPTEYERLTPTKMQELVYAILTDDRIAEYEDSYELDFAYGVPGLSRFRVNMHRQRGTLGAVFRAVPMSPPTLEELRMPPVFSTLVARPRGLILVTGPTGSGKSTTLAAMVNEINLSRAAHVVTVEDPIEFLHRNNRSVVIQREVGSDTKSFNAALRHVLRQDPDVILIGEMRDLETIAAAVTAAETGHLVFATLHTTSAAQTVDRIIDVFPPHQQTQIRLQLSTVIEAIICQCLLPTLGGGGRVAAMEILIGTPAIRNLIREGKTHQMTAVLQSGGKYGMQTLDQALRDLVLKRLVAPELAAAASSDPGEFQALLSNR